MFEFEEACRFVGVPNEAIYKLEFRYREPHRYYHNLEHINKMLSLLNQRRKEYSDFEFRVLVLATIFHDAIYDPTSKLNEENSVKLLLEKCPDMDLPIQKEAFRLIHLTSNEFHHYTPEEDFLGQEFLRLDLNEFFGSFSGVVDMSKKIFKEFQKYDIAEWKAGRIAALTSLAEKSILRDDPIAQTNIEYEIEREKAYQYKVGLFAGSFNPFHAGHMNILKKAELIFDKVIIGFAQNPEKTKQKLQVPRALKYHQVEPIEGFLTDFMDSKDYPITFIKGLRNTADVAEALNQYKFMKEMSEKPVEMVTLFCDHEFEHVSSSALRGIQKIGTGAHPSYMRYIID